MSLPDLPERLSLDTHNIVQIIPGPLPEELENLRRDVLKELDALQADFRRLAAPMHATLAEIEARRGPGSILLQRKPTPSGHAADCDYHAEQVTADCTCGAAR